MLLLPDLITEKIENQGEPLLKFSYDNNAAEINDALRTFQRLFGSKRGWIMTYALIMMLLLTLASIHFYPKQPVLYLTAGLCVIVLVLTVSAPSRKRKVIIKQIESLPPEDYECELFSDKIILKTFTRENTEDKQPDTVIQLLPFNGDHLLDFAENKSALLLFIDGKHYVCFPKRCLPEEQQALLRNALKNASFDAFTNAVLH